MKNYISLLFVLLFISTTNLFGQAPWTKEDQARYMASRFDSMQWDMKRLDGDIEFFNSDNDWPTKPAISDYPSPVPAYDWGFGFIGNHQIKIGGKTIKGAVLGYAKDKYRNHLLSDTSDYYINYFNVFIWTDLEEDEAGAMSIISRNYPHYFSTGKQKTSMGSVDWMHLNLADGQNFAVISQRYFDLEYGKTILIKPLKDGSLRMLQIDDDFGSISSDELMGKHKVVNENPQTNYIQSLENNERVKAFFGDGRMLSSGF